MKMNGMELSLEELEKVTGGKWTPETLTAEERAKLESYQAIIEGYKNGTLTMSPAEFMAASKELLAYVAELDRKYGK